MAENWFKIATFIGLFLFVNTTEFCDQKVLYLRLGSKGLVSCDFGTFRVIGWIIGEDVDDRSPFIYVENSRIQGPGYESGEYDMFQNGSLIINKVTLQHEQMFTARIVRRTDVEHYIIEVKVYVLPVPVYPVVNGLINQQRVVIDDSVGLLSCAMDRVRPNIELELVFLDHVPQDVSLNSIHSSVNNTDGTYNVSLVSNLKVGSNLTGRLRLQCRVAGQMANYFPSVTPIDVLLLSTNFPVVNGSNGEQHVVRDVEREVYLTCAMDKALPNVSLKWVIVTPATSNQMLQEQTSTPPRDQVDGAVTINRNLWLRFPPDAIYARLECRLLIGTEIVRATTVELINKDGHQQRYPTVNGLTNQQHVVLDINREDELTCSWNGVPNYGYLKWDIINPSSDGIIITDHRTHTRDNGDGTYDLSLNSTLSVPNPSVLRVTLHCKVAAPADQWYPEITTAELLLPANSFPVINGLSSQQHVVLDVQRTDVLTCSMHRVSQEVSLQWFIITPDSSEDISLDNQLSRSNNEDGTVNITLNSTVTVTSLSINRVTLQCKVSSLPADSPQVFSTQVELLLPSNYGQSYPTVNGLTNQQHVVLDINREDKLTCSWNGVPKSGYLKWDIINPSSDGIIMTDHRTHTRDNGDGTYDLSLHSTLSVPNPSVLRVTVHCKVAAPADQWYPEITTAELLLPANFDYLPAFPVINGLTSQQHVVLDVQRIDVLTCSMHRVSQEVSLQWLIITPDSSEDISLDDQLSRSDNEDGTVNITLNSTVAVTSLSINRVTLQCKVSRLSADSPQVSSTQVELLLPSNCKEDLQTNKILLGLVIGIFIIVLLIFLLFSFNIYRKVQRQNRYKSRRNSQPVYTVVMTTGETI